MATWILITILREYLKEKFESIYLIVWPRVLDLLSNEVSQLKYDHFKLSKMELVQNAQVHYGVPLFLELFICRVQSQIHNLLNEFWDIDTFLCHNVF